MTIAELLRDLRSQDVTVWIEGDRLRFRGPKHAVTPALVARLKAHKQEIIDWLAMEQHDRGQKKSHRTFALSHGQRALWFLHQRTPDSWAYNVAFAARIRSHVDVVALRRAFAELVARHESLRTTYSGEQQTVQARPSAEDVRFELIDSPDLPLSELQRDVLAAHRRPFDLANGPLARLVLYRRTPDDHVLLLSIHHIACDAWSLWLLQDEFRQLYVAEKACLSKVLPEVRHTYEDLVRWQTHMLRGPEGESHWEFWRSLCAGPLPVLNLATDSPRPRVLTDRGGVVSFSLHDELTRRLRKLSRDEGCTLFTILLTAFGTMLHRYTRQNDILIGSPTSGRGQSEFAEIVGYFVNPVVLRMDFSSDMTVRECLHRTRRLVLSAMDHQDFPFPLLVERIRADRDPSRSPVFQVLFALTRPQTASPVSDLLASASEETRVSWGDVVLEPFEVPQQEGQFELSLEMLEATRAVSGVFKYNSDLFESKTVDRMSLHFRTLLEALAANTDQRVRSLPLTLPDEEEELLQRGAGPASDSPVTVSIQQCFEEQVSLTPDAVALEEGSGRVSYRELNARANQFARYLRRMGVTRGDTVGLSGSRSVRLVTCMLGVLKAGAAYLPLDPEYPPKRLATMLADVPTRLILVAEGARDRWSDGLGNVICFEDAWAESVLENAANLACASAPDDPAYVMFTSGSTGRPKGIAVAHRGVVRLVRNVSYVTLTSEEVLPQLAPLTFDASTFEIWGALLNGAKLVLFPPGPFSLAELGRFLQQHRITTLWLTAGLFHQQAGEDLRALRGLRQLLAGGDVLAPTHVARVLESLPDCCLINGYGPTEATTFACSYPMRSTIPTDRAVPIGRPIEHTSVYILDNDMRLTPAGVPGELYIGGEGVALGYVGQPEMTADRFLPDPFSDRPGRRMYRTGDLARWRNDGHLEFLGRIDHQVKIRGFRVEPEDIEAALVQHDAVREAVVAPRFDRRGDKQLVAYLVPAAQPGPSADELRAFLATQLPAYMMPSIFMTLESLPLNANGKVDRLGLPEPNVMSIAAETQSQQPRTPTEHALLEIWRELLAATGIGIRDNFFSLGGHSLLAMRVVSRIRAAFDVELPLVRLFEAPTVAQLAEVVDLAREEVVTRNLCIEPAHRASELPLSFAQERLWFLNQIEPANPFYNIPAAVRISSRLDEPSLQRSLRQIVARHQSLRTTFVSQGGRPVQRIADRLEIDLHTDDLTALPPDERESQSRRIAEAEAIAPFDLAQGPLLRARLVRIESDAFLFLLTMHHIISDGWSMSVLVRELLTLYEAFSANREPALPDLRIQYADFTLWQRQYLTGDVRKQLLSHWTDRLKDVPVLELPIDFTRPDVQTRRGEVVSDTLPSSMLCELERVGQQERCTLFMCVLAAFDALLHRYTGQDDLAVGAGISNRHRAELEDLIGFFVNLLILRVDVGGQPTFRELLRRVRSVCLDAFDHQDLPFDLLVKELQPERVSNYNPLCRVCIVHQNFPMPSLDSSGLSVRQLQSGTGTAKFDLTLYLHDVPNGLKLELEYNADLFARTTMERLLLHLRALISAAIAAPDTPVSRLAMLDPRELQQLLLRGRGAATDGSSDECVQTLIERQADRSPHGTAILFQNQSLTYEELNRRANQIAHRLIRRGAGPDTLVALCVERSPEMVVGLLGILKAGAAYLPLDPQYPRERLAFMLRDSRTSLLLTDSGLNHQFPDFTGRILDIRALSGLEPEDESNPPCLTSGRNLAYVIYTSGSTGVAKGVAIEHAGLCNLVRAEQSAFQMGDADRVLQFSSLSFDASVWEIFATLASGATLCLGSREEILPGPDLLALMEKFRVTIATMPPSSLLAMPTTSLPDLRVVVSAGEACDRRSVERWGDGRRFINAYGPTEATVCAAMADCRPGAARTPIGLALNHTRLYVLDPHFQPAPVGVPGELYIGGAGVARCYVGQPALTAARFVPDPFGSPGARLYRTGDRVRWLNDGNLEFIGRFDEQVKVRGFRIEPGEIEAVIRDHPAVRDVVVTVDETEADRRSLCAFVVPDHGAIPTPTEELAGFRTDRVAEWQRLYDENYRRPPSHPDLDFNIVGWESAYTGEPIPAQEMREWVDTTVRRILSRQPRRVLEIGCGSGLLLFPIARHVTSYVASDFSETAIAYLQRRLEEASPQYANVRLLRKAAHELDPDEFSEYDAVILNSVVQYFPGLDYLLNVLHNAIRCARPGGFVFVGDVRNLKLLEAFHASVQWHRSAHAMSCDEQALQTGDRMGRDQELSIDPRLFHTFARHEPRVTHVETQLKRGRFENELTRFRYDAVLEIESPIVPVPVTWRPWSEGSNCNQELRKELSGSNGLKCLGFRNVPNGRLRNERALLRWMHASSEAERSTPHRELIEGSQREAVDPESLWSIGEDLGFDVQVNWSDDPMNLDVVFHKKLADFERPVLSKSRRDGTTPLSRLVNDPLERRLTRQLMDDLRRRLRDRLPDYMIPATILPVATLPRTPSGKADRKTLRAMLRAGDRRDRGHSPPRTSAERTLAEIWREVLGIDRVGIDDNFFELGGDSILGIQVVARAKSRGLRFSPLQLFQYQTVAELAGVVQPVNHPSQPDTPLRGPCALTPIQRWLFEQAPADAHHFNQSLLLETNGEDPEILRAALAHVCDYHDVLRLRFRRAGDQWRSEFDPDNKSLLFETVDLSTLADHEQIAQLEHRCQREQVSIDLDGGPLARAIHFHLGRGRPGRLLIVVHHLVVDAISWRILLEDMATAYGQLQRGERIELPVKTTSFPEWSRRLSEYALSADALAELPFWESATAGVSSSIPVCFAEGHNSVASAESLECRFSSVETNALLADAASRHDSRPEELLLAALLRSYHGWSSHERLLLDVESHGRAEMLPGVDVTRTVGWFTSLFPVLLTTSAADDLSRQIDSVKERLHAIPNLGVGFGVLRYLGPEDARSHLASQPRAKVVFNYFGKAEELRVAGPASLRLARESAGMQRSPSMLRRHTLEINARVTGGELSVEWIYSRNLHQRERVEQLVSGFRAAIADLTDAPAAAPTRRRMPADAAEIKLGREEWGRLTTRHEGIEDAYETTPTQEGLLFHSLAAPDSGAYVMQLCGGITGDREARAFVEAWQRAIDRQPVLRTSFWWRDRDKPLQLVHSKARLPVEVVDCRDRSAEQVSEFIESTIIRDRRDSFDLERAPLIRLKLIRTSDDHYRFLLSHHHLLLDGWSLPLLLRELLAHCEAILSGRESHLPDARPFRDHIVWLRQRKLAQAERFWRTYLSGFTSPTDLGITTMPSTGPAHGEHRERLLNLDEELAKSLRQFARTHQLTLNTCLQGAWALLLSGYSGTSDVVFGSTFSGRASAIPGIETMLGMLINTLPVRIRAPRNGRLDEWLKRLQQRQVELRACEHSALSDIQAWSDVPRGTPLFETLLVFENYPIDEDLLRTLRERLPISDLRFVEQTHYPITLTVDAGRSMALRLGYDAGRFDDSCAERLLRHTTNILRQFVASPRAQLAEIELTTRREQQQALLDFNQTSCAYPEESSVVEMFRQRALGNPGSVAVECEGVQLTYESLDRQSDQLADLLVRRGVGLGSRVGICMRRSEQLVVGLLGIMKAGACYVPMDPGFPDERLRFMLADSRAMLLLTDSSQLSRLKGWGLPAACEAEQQATSGCLVIDCGCVAASSGMGATGFADRQDEWLVEDSAKTAGSVVREEPGRIQPMPSARVAYIIYTSGSTGRPKGVLVSHRALTNFLIAMRREIGISSGDVMLAVTTVSFDIAGLEIFLPLITGAKVVLASREVASDGLALARLIDDCEASVMQGTPATWRMLLDAGWQGRKRLKILVGGEALPDSLAGALVRSGFAAWNLYGPTETTIWSTSAKLVADTRRVTIGRPIANTQAYVLDLHLRPTPLGVPGELFLGGDGVAYGYWNRPDLTAERFCPDPFSGVAGSRLYRTGDRCRWLADGSLEFLGRVDLQVKVRGFRVEPSEIEGAILQYPGIESAAVSVWDDGTGLAQLVAYLVAAAAEPTIGALRQFLKDRLPDYMIPASFVFLDALPLTPNGKLDRKSLPAPSTSRPLLDKPFEPPANALEASLVEIWSEVLGIEPVGVLDNFFELGGASMKAVRIVAKVLERGLVSDSNRFAPELVFRFPTIREIAARLAEADNPYILDSQSSARRSP